MSNKTTASKKNKTNKVAGVAAEVSQTDYNTYPTTPEVPTSYLMVTWNGQEPKMYSWFMLMVECEQKKLDVFTDANGPVIELTKKGKKVGSFTQHGN